MHAPQHDTGLHRRLVGYARRFVGDHAEAEDIAQDTWMRAVRHALPAERPEAWLFRVCRHAAIDHVRARRVRKPVWRQAAEPGSLEAPAPEPVGAEPSPRLGSLLREHGRLSPSQRLLLDLHYGRTVPQPALCRMAGLEPSALRVRLFRARRALASA